MATGGMFEVGGWPLQIFLSCSSSAGNCLPRSSEQLSSPSEEAWLRLDVHICVMGVLSCGTN